jgi:hypothetical protein
MNTNDKNVSLNLEKLEERAVPTSFAYVNGRMIYVPPQANDLTVRGQDPVLNNYIARPNSMKQEVTKISYNYDWNMNTRAAYVVAPGGRSYIVATNGMKISNATPVPTVKQINTVVVDHVFSNPYGYFKLSSNARQINGTVQWNDITIGRRI